MRVKIENIDYTTAGFIIFLVTCYLCFPVLHFKSLRTNCNSIERKELCVIHSIISSEIRPCRDPPAGEGLCLSIGPYKLLLNN